MTTNTIVEMPRWQKIVGILVFAAMTALSLWLFATTWPLWWTGTHTDSPVIMFYTTIGYLLGGSLFFLVLIIGAMVNLWGSQTVTRLWRQSEVPLVMACALIMFLLPWLGNPMIVWYLQEHGYTECPAASKHDFKFSRIAFVRADVACSAELKP